MPEPSTTNSLTASVRPSRLTAGSMYPEPSLGRSGRGTRSYSLTASHRVTYTAPPSGTARWKTTVPSALVTADVTRVSSRRPDTGVDATAPVTASTTRSERPSAATTATGSAGSPPVGPACGVVSGADVGGGAVGPVAS